MYRRVDRNEILFILVSVTRLCKLSMSSIETELKLEIKAWEHSFKKENGRNPTKEDIKKNTEIAAKYKEYKSLKYGVPKDMPKPKTSYSTPTKKRTKQTPQFHTPHKTSSPVKVPGTPIDVDELGPTPQLNGRVLGLFEVITSPKTTPQTTSIITKEETTLTPVKKNLDFSGLVEGDEEFQFKTPQKPIPLNKVQETPLYLKPGGSKEITASPSPLASQRIKKGLSTIISEFRDIQAELKYGDFDEEQLEISPLAEIQEENERELEDGQSAIPKWKKKKTQKRTTRRYVIRARPTTEKDTMKGKDVQNEIQKIEERTQNNEEVQETDDSEEWSDGPEEYIPKARSVDNSNLKKKRPAGESQNFKRLKLRDGRSKRNFGKRSRGW